MLAATVLPAGASDRALRLAPAPPTRTSGPSSRLAGAAINVHDTALLTRRPQAIGAGAHGELHPRYGASELCVPPMQGGGGTGSVGAARASS